MVEKPDFPLVIPRDADCGLYLVEQFRYPVGGRDVVRCGRGVDRVKASRSDKLRSCERVSR